MWNNLLVQLTYYVLEKARAEIWSAYTANFPKPQIELFIRSLYMFRDCEGILQLCIIVFFNDYLVPLRDIANEEIFVAIEKVFVVISHSRWFKN